MTHIVSKTKNYVILRMPIYRTKIYVMDIKKQVSVLKRMPIDLKDVVQECDGDIANCQTVTNPKTKAVAVLMRLSAQYDESTLWHESIHVAAMVLENAGIDYTDNHGEQLAYSVEWIVKMVKESFYNQPVDFND